MMVQTGMAPLSSWLLCHGQGKQNKSDKSNTLPSFHLNHAPTPLFDCMQLTYHHQEKHHCYKSTHLLSQGALTKAKIQVPLVQKPHEEKERKEIFQAHMIVTSNNKILHSSTHLPVSHQNSQGWLLHHVLHSGSRETHQNLSSMVTSFVAFFKEHPKIVAFPAQANTSSKSYYSQFDTDLFTLGIDTL